MLPARWPRIVRVRCQPAKSNPSLEAFRLGSDTRSAGVGMLADAVNLALPMSAVMVGFAAAGARPQRKGPSLVPGPSSYSSRKNDLTLFVRVGSAGNFYELHSRPDRRNHACPASVECQLVEMPIRLRDAALLGAAELTSHSSAATAPGRPKRCLRSNRKGTGRNDKRRNCRHSSAA